MRKSITKNHTEVPITIRNSNEDPYAILDSATTDEDTTVIIDPLDTAIDSDNDTLELPTVTNGTLGSAQIINQTIQYTPNENANGQDTISYTIE